MADYRSAMDEMEDEFAMISMEDEETGGITYDDEDGGLRHSDKFCEKLFDTPEDKIEKPFGAWMRADPRRRMHTMGSKWLRPGGVTPVKSSVEEGGVRSGSVTNARGINHGNSGMDLGDNLKATTSSVGVNQGEAGKQIVTFESLLPRSQGNKSSTNGKNIIVDPKEMSSNDPKKRRVEDIYGPEIRESPDLEMLLSPQEHEIQNQKNLLMAGAALQARQSL
ncbi:hypothetical protein POM88_014116 [Heracleum sosnowskyi]|uniref:Uncharacterized protein n=1 Tax=Heracleum sosnowskyi TaxID=360622 RepID=A0AAD8IZT5_9APIA|nr:hypothetical protein POM88_014116 [Heracleum sosnowskyi]